MKSPRWLVRGGALIAAVPALSGCSSGTRPYQCPPDKIVAWNGQLPDGGEHDGGVVVYEVCRSVCGPNGGCACWLVDAGTLNCTTCCGGGRAPPGLLSLSAVDGSAGSWVARMAELESAAVTAFARLAEELDAHGLESYAHHARAAAIEESRHATVVTRLALGFGHCPSPVRLGPSEAIRSLEEIAIDNAGEGCGRELFGAAVNQWQATHASDPKVRSVMESISPDEHSHAEYSFSLAEKLNAQLTISQRRRAREAQERMLSDFGSIDASGPARRLLGLMEPEQVASTARTLLERHRI